MALPAPVRDGASSSSSSPKPRDASKAGHPSGVRFAGSVFFARKPEGGALAVRSSASPFASHAVRVFATADDLRADLARLRSRTGAALLSARATAVVGLRAAKAQALAASAELLAQLVPESAPASQAAVLPRFRFCNAPREVAAARWLLRHRAARDDDAAWEAACTAERLADGECPVWSAPGILTQTRPTAPLARPYFFSRAALRRFVNAAVDTTASRRRSERRMQRCVSRGWLSPRLLRVLMRALAPHSAFMLSRKQLSCEMACEHLSWLQARARRPPPAPPAADSSDSDSDDDEDGDSERDRMIAEASREMGGTVKSSSSSSAAAAANAAANSQRVQLAMMSAAFSVLLGSVTALAHCWAAGAVEDVTDRMALFTLSGRRFLATGSKQDPARLEALSVASLNEMLARRPEYNALYASGKTRRKQWTGLDPSPDDTLQGMLRMIFGDRASALLGDADGDADGAPKKDKEEAPPPRVSFDPTEARDYLSGRWREGPTWADVQPLVVGHLDDAELKKLAANAQICSRLPSAKRRKESITGT